MRPSATRAIGGCTSERELQGRPGMWRCARASARLLNPFIEPEFVAERVEKMKASVRAKVEHPFRVIKQQFGFTKVRYRGLAKNTAQIVTLFALSNLWMTRAQADGGQGMSASARPETGLQGGHGGCPTQQTVADLARSSHLVAATSPCSFSRDCRTCSADGMGASLLVQLPPGPG